MCTLDFRGSAEGVTGTTQQTIEAETYNLALVSLLAAFIEVWHVLILFCSGGLAYTSQWQIGYKPQSTIFHIYCQSRKCLTVVFDVTSSAANWYILHKFTGDL